MQVDSIISNTITQDILLKGHQSIRFAQDGFSLLVTDSSYKPVLLQRYRYDATVSPTLYPAECGRLLDEKGLLGFEGETVIIPDSLAVTVVPDQLFMEQKAGELLESACELENSDLVQHRYLRDRKLNIVYAVPMEIMELKGRFSGSVVTLSASECLVSLADQIKASDHQRGFLMVDVQQFSMDILFIQEDKIMLLNRYGLKDPSQFIYYALNTIRQLELDREHIPLYLSGMVHPEHELFGLLRKYVRRIRTTSYYLEGISREDMLSFMILSEAIRCV